MRSRQSLVGKIGGLALALGAIAAPSGCERNAPIAPTNQNNNQSFVYDVRNDIHGFGKLREISEDSPLHPPIYFHELFRTTDNQYFIGKLGAGLYAIDAKTGQLLNTFAHEITNRNLSEKGLRVKVGSLEYDTTPPTSFKDFEEWEVEKPDDWVPREFEERDGGVFVKDWKPIR